MLKITVTTSDTKSQAVIVNGRQKRYEQIAAVLQELPSPDKGGVWYGDLVSELVARYGLKSYHWQSYLSMYFPGDTCCLGTKQCLSGFRKYRHENGMVRFTRVPR